MTFTDYYTKLKKNHITLRDQVCKELSISTETFYLKMKNNTWDPGQRLILSNLTSIPEKELFPNTSKNSSNV
jgi:hypothetical protein